MFLDPDPKRRKTTGAGFFSSQRPVESPRDRRATWSRKHFPLEERSQSENNQQNPDPNPIRPTVRLVKPSQEPLTGSGSEDDEDSAARKENRPNVQYLEHLPSSPTGVIETSVLKPGSSGSADSDQGFQVSGTPTSTNEAQSSARFGYNSLLPSTTSYAIPRTEWHRRSGSSSHHSYSSTLRGSDIAYGQKSLRSESRTSEGTTLRGTPTPTEPEFRERIGAEESSRQTSAQRLEPLQETSPERSTVRLLPTQAESPSSGDQTSPERLDSSATRPRTSPPDSEQEATLSQTSSRQPSSAGSLPASHNIRTFAISPTPQHQRSEESLAQSETALPTASSPNLEAFHSDSSRPRSRSQPLHATTSIESIQSRLQSPAISRPATGRSVASSNSWASRAPSTDNLPPIQVPKKRLRHKAASSSLNGAKASGSESAMEDVDIDHQPYPRQAFSMHLSTIASESGPPSRTASQQLSHFSLGSGVWTGDESSSIRHSGNWPQLRTESAREEYEVSDRSPVSPIVPTLSSGEEPEDMTMGVYREASALPQPLFHPRSPSAPLFNKRYDGPLPPIPPIPNSRESDEDFDTVPELTRPSLHQQRSGYSLRRRSHSTPSGSHSREKSYASESSRWSQGTNIFPTWAKAYYAYGATLLSSSQISLNAPLDSDRPHVYRINRDWNARSYASSWAASDVESPSPASSRFLPSIFRPRTKREKSDNSKKRKNKGNKTSPRKTSPREGNSRPDSMVISRDPLPSGQQDGLPFGQTRYGSLKDQSDPHHRPLPRTYSKQKKWNEMEFPRPMSKDYLGGNVSVPHLSPNKRLGSRISAWRPPSFVESLDTLVRSRCNRQILLFALGFICPLCWIAASFLPLPTKPMSASDFEKVQGFEASEEDIQTAMMKHEAGDAEKRWREERQWLKARWWRYLNRIMSVIGLLVIGAIIALAVVATM